MEKKIRADIIKIGNLKINKLLIQIIFRLKVQWEIVPTIQNIKLEFNPWINKQKIENVFLLEYKKIKVNKRKLRWQTLENATKDFPSLWKQQIKQAKTEPKILTNKKKKLKRLINVFKIKQIPKPPSFNKRPAKIIEPNVGASTWALGNQIWNKNIGNFTKKLNLKQNKEIKLIDQKINIFCKGKNKILINKGNEEKIVYNKRK